MAQPTSFLLKYSGAFAAKQGVKYLGATFSDINVMQMKSEGIKASVNGSPLFDVAFDDMTVVDSTAEYSFNKDCIIATGSIVEVAV